MGQEKKEQALMDNAYAFVAAISIRAFCLGSGFL